MAKKYHLACLGTDEKGREFLRSYQSGLTEKEAYIESGKWKNCSHFRLETDDGAAWATWGKRP